jgi:ATPase family associated with various cellular activities (AAA)
MMSDTKQVQDENIVRPPASELPRFKWGSTLHWQAFKQRLVLNHLPDHALFYLEKETEDDWEPEPYAEEKWLENEALSISVGRGLSVCPYCDGTAYVRRHYTGKNTGIKIYKLEMCRCVFYQMFYSRWYNPSCVSADYRNVTMKNLGTFEANFGTFQGDRLTELLETVSMKTRNCMLLAGRAGMGKTTLMTALYNRALKTWARTCFEHNIQTDAVWKVNAPLLAKQHHAWSIRGDNPNSEKVRAPEVTVDMVHAAIRHNLVPHLFLDEFDKVKLDSDFQAKEFAALITAFQENGGVVVASANTSELELQQKLGTLIGPTTVRRLIGPRLNPDASDKSPINPERNGILIDFSAGKITHGHKLASVKADKTEENVAKGKGSGGAKQGSNQKPQNLKPQQDDLKPQATTPPAGESSEAKVEAARKRREKADAQAATAKRISTVTGKKALGITNV